MMPGIPLLTLLEVKARLGLESDDDTYDDKMTPALNLVTTWFEQFCGRGLAARVIVGEELFDQPGPRIFPWAYPLTTLTAVKFDDTTKNVALFRVNKAAGYFFDKGGAPLSVSPIRFVELSYTGGYAAAAVPEDLAQAYASAVGVRAGVPDAAAAGGSSASGTIKSIGLGGGALQVAFETANPTGGLEGTFDVSNVPVEVQPYASVLSYYCRQRV